MKENKLTLVIMRVSTTRQDFAVQRKALESLTKRHGVQPIPLDRFLALRKLGPGATPLAVSIEDKGSGRTANRPGYQWCLNEINEGHVSKVLCFDLTRLDRNIHNALRFAEACRKHKVKIDTCQGPVDLETREGALQYQILASIAEYNRRTISENAVASHQAFMAEQALLPAAERRKWGGGKRGRMSDRIKKEIPLVYEMRDAGASLNKIGRVTALPARTVRYLLARRDDPTLTYRAFQDSRRRDGG